jgi:hypothetical protein
MKKSVVSKRNNTLNDESEENSENNDHVPNMMPRANFEMLDNDDDDNNGAEAIILSGGGKGDRQYRLSTGSNYVYDEGRKSAKVE